MTDDLLLGHLAEEFTRRVREGTRPEIEEYARNHPELADRIRELFPTLIFLERVLRWDRASHGRI
jgi:eukaryotic-like serine/threonine-protein kinase